MFEITYIYFLSNLRSKFFLNSISKSTVFKGGEKPYRVSQNTLSSFILEDNINVISKYQEIVFFIFFLSLKLGAFIKKEGISKNFARAT